MLTHADRQKLAKYIYNDNASLASEGARAMRRGFSGMLDGIPLKASNQLGRITTGTRTNGTVSRREPERELLDRRGCQRQRLLPDPDVQRRRSGRGGTVKAGEVFSITSGTAVNAYDPEIGQARPYTQQFVVVEDATVDTAAPPRSASSRRSSSRLAARPRAPTP